MPPWPLKSTVNGVPAVPTAEWPVLLPCPALPCRAQAALDLHADDAVEAALKRASAAEAAAARAAEDAALAAAQVSWGYLLLWS
jgi:hypothetical protein